MERFDVVVVGGGPIGAATARVAASAGASVLLLEQRGPMDEPSVCAGLVSPRTLAVLGASDSCVLRRLRRVGFHAPGGGSLSVEATSDRAFVIDRAILERELLAHARDAGAIVRTQTAATGLQHGSVAVHTKDGTEAVRCAVVVGADGPDSQVASWAGLTGARRGMRAAQAELALDAEAPDEIHVFVGQRVAPGFFAWAIPAEGKRLRVGLAVRPGLDPVPYLQALLTQHYSSQRVLSQREGVIPSPPSGPIATDWVLLVGDAAAQVKPLSGGGLYFGGLCARAAGSAAAAAALSGDSHALSRYPQACRSLIGAETQFGLAARSVRESLRDREWDSVMGALANPDILEFVAERVDLDHFRYMLSHAATRPAAWRALLRAADVLRGRVRDRVCAASSEDGL